MRITFFWKAAYVCLHLHTQIYINTCIIEEMYIIHMHTSHISPFKTLLFCFLFITLTWLYLHTLFCFVFVLCLSLFACSCFLNFSLQSDKIFKLGFSTRWKGISEESYWEVVCAWRNHAVCKVEISKCLVSWPSKDKIN